MSALVTLGFFYTLLAVGIFTAALVICATVGYETIMRRYRLGERHEMMERLIQTPSDDNSKQKQLIKTTSLPG